MRKGNLRRAVNRLKRRAAFAYSRPEQWLYAKSIVSPGLLNLPDFLGIGALKTGTSWLYDNLRQHPDLYLPEEKELHYFDLRFHKPLRWYAGNFEPGRGKVKGEITPAYGMLDRKRIGFIRAVMPEVRLIFLIRNPIERAWSDAVRRVVGADGLLAPEQREEFVRHYHTIEEIEFRRYLRTRAAQQRGDYLSMLGNWLATFPREQLYVGFTDDVARRPQALLTAVFSHLGVSTDVAWDAFPYRQVVHRGLGLPIPQSLMPLLEQLYGEQIEALYELFGAPIAHWRPAQSQKIRDESEPS